MTPTQAQAELMAAVASRAQTEAEAEAMVGAATVGAHLAGATAPPCGASCRTWCAAPRSSPASCAGAAPRGRPCAPSRPSSRGTARTLPAAPPPASR